MIHLQIGGFPSHTPLSAHSFNTPKSLSILLPSSLVHCQEIIPYQILPIGRFSGNHTPYTFIVLCFMEHIWVLKLHFTNIVYICRYVSIIDSSLCVSYGSCCTVKCMVSFSTSCVMGSCVLLQVTGVMTLSPHFTPVLPNSTLPYSTPKLDRKTPQYKTQQSSTLQYILPWHFQAKCGSRQSVAQQHVTAVYSNL